VIVDASIARRNMSFTEGLQTMKQKERVQFDFSPEALQRLDEIKEKTGAASRAETVRNALRLYEWFVSEADPEGTIKVYDRDNELTSVFKAKLLNLALNLH
jgi:hypothetical protein